MEKNTLHLDTCRNCTGDVGILGYLELLNSTVHLNSENVISLRGEEEEKIRLQNMKGYLNFKNFRLQIGKMQEDGNTIYTPKTMGLFVDYILDHAELDENGNGNVIIQLWPDLAQCLSQNGKKGILTFTQEKEEIEKIIKEKLKEKGKNIKIEIKSVADNYPDVFNAIKKGKEGIIPNEEPKLENFELPLKSPKPIIEYLAYHFNKDTNLGKLFYSTKPAKYKEQDGENYIPGTSGADYYSVVEVGIRLYEVLNGIYIQGGIDRQRVYDKIIYLILFGEDKIGKKNEQLNIEHYPSLGKLHNFLNKSGEYDNVKMMQLHIDLKKVKSETKKAKEGLEQKLKDASSEIAPKVIAQYRENLKILEKALKAIEDFEKQNNELQKLIYQQEKGLSRNKQLLNCAIAIFLVLFGGKAFDEYSKAQSLQNYEYTHTPETNKIEISQDLLKDCEHALSLDIFNRDAVLDYFKEFVSLNKLEEKGLSKAEIINKFYNEQGVFLIKHLGIRFAPYEFINKLSPSTIENTINATTNYDYKKRNNIESATIEIEKGIWGIITSKQGELLYYDYDRLNNIHNVAMLRKKVNIYYIGDKCYYCLEIPFGDKKLLFAKIGNGDGIYSLQLGYEVANDIIKNKWV